MPRFPRIKDIENKKDAEGNLICRNCENKVPENRRNYCSQKCMQEFNEAHSWFWIRKAVLKRDKYRCSICGQKFRKKQLHVDHIIPVGEGGQLLDKKNLRTLCKECHKAKTNLDKWGFKDA